jgi:mRNA interferase RelE/StbE
MYKIGLLREATQDLEILDKQIANRVTTRLNWLAENIDSVKREQLTGDLAGLYKIRVGDYRILYEVLDSEQTILVYTKGQRKDIYR